ncbi:MAG: hypothetical protein IT457_13980 [Planctomycetes bacterium]|nr:hypothetical protein [Planctomycetota bacterium]
MRVLVVRLSAMGDVVQGLAMLRALRAALPADEIAWVVQRPFASLLEDLGLAAVFAHDRRAGPLGYLRTARALRAWRPDVALDLQGNWKSAGLAWASGARRRLGSPHTQRREARSAWLATEAVSADSPHPDDVATALARVLVPGLAVSHAPVLCARDDECAREAAALRALGIAPDRPFRVLVLADPRDPRALPEDELTAAARSSRDPVLALAGPDDAAGLAPAAVHVVRHARGELRRLIALGTLGRRAGATALGPDKGAAHVLAACGLSTTIVHRTTDPARTGSRHAHELRVAQSSSAAISRSSMRP